MIKSLLRQIVPTRLWEMARRMRIQRHTAQFQRLVATHLYSGYQLQVVLADSLSQGWYDHDWDALQEIELLKKGRLKEGARVFDLGAHQGIVAMILVRTVGPNGHVLAVEGMEHNCEIARENARLNAIENLHVKYAAVSDSPGTVQFFDGLNGSVARHQVGAVVEAVAIDQLAEQQGMPDVVFVDIEGYEHHALLGATKVLSQPCDWFIEVHVECGLEEYGKTAQDIVAFFDSNRYDRFLVPLEGNEAPQTYNDIDPLPTKRFGFVAIHQS